jgi:uncharacterized OB-fold protein
MLAGNKERFLNPRYFADSPQGPVLVGSKCQSCGCVFFPRKFLCTKCFSRNKMESVRLNTKGKLGSYAIVYRSHIGLKTPFAVGYIDLQEKIRLFSILSGCEPFDRIKIGMEMQMIVEKLMKDPFGYDVMVYKFRPAR